MSNPMTLDQMQAIAKLLLNHPKYGLLANTSESHITTRGLLEQLQSFLEYPERISRDDWSTLKSSSLLEVGDAAADCLSRICSAFRSPDVALSCFRDAAEKLAELNAERAKQNTLEQLRYQFKETLLIENMMSHAKS
jgi:hypothetical protein